MEDEIDEWVLPFPFFRRFADSERCYRKDPTSDHFLLIQRNEDGSEEDAGTIRWRVSVSLALFPIFVR